MYKTQDLQALRQVINDFKQPLTIIRKYNPQYDVRGRYNYVEVRETIQGVLQPNGSKTIRLNDGGAGEWTTVEYTLTVVNPTVIREGDLLVTPKGVLKLVSLEDWRDYGMMQANLVRTGSNDAYLNTGDNSPYENT